MRFRGFLIIAVLLALALPAVCADNILINSRDWKDVYSGMQYGFHTGVQPKFLVSEQHSTIILSDLPVEQPLTVLNSRKNPFVVGYGSLLTGKGYTVDELEFNSLSLELAEMLSDINNYIIIDDSYGYNSIAVAPYAIASKSFVLFADRNNIGEVENFLESRNPGIVLIYGHVDREVKDRLASFNPEIINMDGDRFANNVEIVKKFMEISPTQQVILTNGEFIEQELMSGQFPVLFIGIQNVPPKIHDYIVNSNIQVGVLIGNELVGTATTVRRDTGISTFVKFARSARQTEGPIAQVEGLDIFRLPSIELSLSIEGITYNALTNQLEVTFKNNVEIATYFKGTYTVISGDQQQTVGDTEPVFIDGSDTKTVVYDVDPISGDEIIARVFVIFGESKDALERTLQGEIAVKRVEVLDDTAISIEKVVYQKSRGSFLISVENIGALDVYVDTELHDVLVAGERQTFAAKEVIKISPGAKKNSVVPADLAEEDFDSNPRIKVRAYYGQRENALVKILEGEFDLIISTFDVLIYLPIIIILLLIFLILWRRKRKKKHHS